MSVLLGHQCGIRVDPQSARFQASWIGWPGLPLEDLFFSAVGEAELRYGAAILPGGRRRETLLADIEGMLREAFGERVLRSTERRRASTRTSRRHNVPPAALSRQSDRQIAAIARSRGMAVATRNVRDFDDIGVDIVNPWTVA